MMCGIAGLLGESPADPASALSALSHRGPDDEGVFRSDRIWFGHRRLSIVDLSSAGHQPMERDGNVIVFNGMIYNFQPLRDELSAAGYEFRSKSDTEVLLHAYRHWGTKAFERLRGFFALAIWDASADELTCARDPFGKKPLYYSFDGRRFGFASEVQALVAMLSARPRIRRDGIAHYLLTGYFEPGRSVYDGIDCLPAGHVLTVDAEAMRIRLEPFNTPRFRPGRKRDRETIMRRAEELVDESVRRRLIADVPIGLLLSGGVDSALTGFTATRLSSGSLEAFTVRFPGSSADEAGADYVARRAGIEHHLLPLSSVDFRTTFPALVRAYGEPFGDTSALPTYLIFEALKGRVKVALTGDGGDELFGGYRDLDTFRLRRRLRPLSGVGNLVSLARLERLTNSRFTKVREAAFGIAATRRSSSELLYLLHRGGWTRGWRKRYFRPEAVLAVAGAHADESLLGRFEENGTTDFERYMNWSIERLTQGFLTKLDRASMAHGIEARSPLLDIDLFEWAGRLAVGDLLPRGERKAILKRLLDRYVEPEYSRQTKRGFSPPLVAWFAEPDTLSWIRTRLTMPDGPIDWLIAPGAVDDMLGALARGSDHTLRIWRLLFLAEWCESVAGDVRFS